jgi:hypothetical protein
VAAHAISLPVWTASIHPSIHLPSLPPPSHNPLNHSKKRKKNPNQTKPQSREKLNLDHHLPNNKVSLHLHLHIINNHHHHISSTSFGTLKGLIVLPSLTTTYYLFLSNIKNMANPGHVAGGLKGVLNNPVRKHCSMHSGTR